MLPKGILGTYKVDFITAIFDFLAAISMANKTLDQLMGRTTHENALHLRMGLHMVLGCQ